MQHKRLMKRGRGLGWVSALSSLLVLMAAVPYAGATTYYLNPASGSDGNQGTQGSPWKTMAKVKNTVGAGDIVNVVGGTYTPAQYQGESWIPAWTEANSLGTAGNPITIQANPGETVIFDGNGQSYWLLFMGTPSYPGHYVIIQNMTFQNYTTTAMGFGSPSIAAPARYMAVLNCTFRNFYDQDSGVLVTAKGTDHILIKGNTFFNIGDTSQGFNGAGDHAVYIAEGSSYIVVENNAMEKIAGFGVHAWGHYDLSVTNTNIIVRKNKIVNTYEASTIFAGTNFQNTYLYNNTFYQEPSPFPGINTNDGDSMFTIRLGGAYTNLVAINNIGDGYLSAAPVYLDTPSEVTTLRLNYNLWRNQRTASQTYLWAAVYRTLPEFAVTGYETGSLVASPLFTNAASRDFTLQAGSPAINAGTPLTTTVGSGSGTALTVADAGYFHNGFGLIPGDTIVINGTGEVAITAVNYTTRVLTLAASRTWGSGASVSLPFFGSAPDMGAIESSSTGGGTLPIPTNLRLGN